MLFQQAVQEKFRQATENIDDLNKWLEKVEREIASQSIPHEDVDGLKNQINALKVGSWNLCCQPFETKLIPIKCFGVMSIALQFIVPIRRSSF